MAHTHIKQYIQTDHSDNSCTHSITNVVVQHPDDRRSLAVGDGIKDLVHLRGSAHLHLITRQLQISLLLCFLGFWDRVIPLLELRYR